MIREEIENKQAVFDKVNKKNPSKPLTPAEKFICGLAEVFVKCGIDKVTTVNGYLHSVTFPDGSVLHWKTIAEKFKIK